MDLINDLGTELALAFLVEKRYGQKIDSEEARALITRVTSVLKRSQVDDPGGTAPDPDEINAAENGH